MNSSTLEGGAVTTTTKPCTRCKADRPLTAFPFRSDTRKRRSVCQRCINDVPAKSPAQPKPQTRRAPDLPRPDWGWQDDASCRGEDLVLFFGPDGERQPERQVREEKAKLICRGCPVRTCCLDYAVSRPEKFGTWGGLNEDERVAERRRRMRKANAA